MSPTARVLIPLALITSLAAPSAASPHFWMNDLRLEGKAGVEMMMGNPPGPLVGDDTFTITSDIYAKFDVARSLLLSFRLPLALGFFDDPVDGDDSGAALGNVGVGVTGVRVTRTGESSVRFGLGGILYLPTASDSGDAGLVANLASLMAVPDYGRWAPATTVRGRADVLFASGAFFFQGELNLDVFFVDDADDDVDLTIGLGPGFDLTHQLSLLAELSIANISDNSVQVFDFGMRYQTRAAIFGVRLYIPTDEFSGEDVIGVGIDASGRF